MTLQKFLGAALACTIVCATAILAQDQGYWRAESSNAKSITGDVSFSSYKISINFSTFTIAQIRALKPDEARTLFNADDPTAGAGNLYRLNIPSTRRFAHHNTLCGDVDTDWVITYVQGRTLQLAFFSGPSIPTLTPEALNSNARVCAVLSYQR